ncbi:MAG: FtsB family cell division protein [Acutalibacteraceae bacterium]
MVRLLEKPKKKKSIFLRLAFIVVFIYVAVVFVNQQVTIAQKKQEYQQLSAQLAEQKAQNAELRELSENEDLTAYYELIARGTLNYAYPGEKVYVDISGN